MAPRRRARARPRPRRAPPASGTACAPARPRAPRRVLLASESAAGAARLGSAQRGIELGLEAAVGALPQAVLAPCAPAPAAAPPGRRESSRSYSATEAKLGSRFDSISMRMRVVPRASSSGPMSTSTRPAMRSGCGRRRAWRCARRASGHQHQALDAERGGHASTSAPVCRSRSAPRVPGGVAVAAEIERERAVVRRDDGREVVPDVRVVAEAVEQQQRHAVALHSSRWSERPSPPRVASGAWRRSVQAGCGSRRGNCAAPAVRARHASRVLRLRRVAASAARVVQLPTTVAGGARARLRADARRPGRARAHPGRLGAGLRARAGRALGRARGGAARGRGARRASSCCALPGAHPSVVGEWRAARPGRADRPRLRAPRRAAARAAPSTGGRRPSSRRCAATAASTAAAWSTTRRACCSTWRRCAPGSRRRARRR